MRTGSTVVGVGLVIAVLLLGLWNVGRGPVTTVYSQDIGAAPVQGGDPANGPLGHFPFVSGGTTATGMVRPLQVDSRGRVAVGGGYSTVTSYAPTVVVTPNATPVVAANSNRLWLLCQNDSDTTIYLRPGATAVADTGIRLNAGGGSYEMAPPNGNLYTGALYAVATVTGKTLMCLEGQ